MSKAIDLKSKILEVLLTHFDSKPALPMTFNELYKATGVHPSDGGDIWYQFLFMKEMGLIQYESLADGTGGTVTITAKGVQVAKDRRETLKRAKQSAKGTSVSSCPISLGELIQRNPNCAHIIQHGNLVDEIQQYLASARTSTLTPNYIVLYGQPMTGKTRILYRLSQVLSNEYVPLIATIQGSTLEGLNYFLFDLASQLTTNFNDWARRHKVSAVLDTPKWEKYKKGTEGEAFREHWHAFRQLAGERHPVFMFDEVERLLDPINKS